MKVFGDSAADRQIRLLLSRPVENAGPPISLPLFMLLFTPARGGVKIE